VHRNVNYSNASRTVRITSRVLYLSVYRVLSVPSRIYRGETASNRYSECARAMSAVSENGVQTTARVPEIPVNCPQDNATAACRSGKTPLRDRLTGFGGGGIKRTVPMRFAERCVIFGDERTRMIGTTGRHNIILLYCYYRCYCCCYYATIAYLYTPILIGKRSVVDLTNPLQWLQIRCLLVLFLVGGRGIQYMI